MPPWINKFYVLDLNPEKSFIRWAVAQGLTVFMISWVNPDERHQNKGFEAYMREGIFAALDGIEAATGETEVSTVGYCVGGTLLAVTLAYMAEIGDKRIRSATLFTTQVDFTDAGDLKLFVDAEQIAADRTEDAGDRLSRGLADGDRLQHAAARTISSGPIGSTIISRARSRWRSTCWSGTPIRRACPPPTTRFYLRHCYLQNDLTNDRMVIEGKPISPAQGDDPDLRSGRARGPYRAGALGVQRLEVFRRARCAT